MITGHTATAMDVGLPAVTEIMAAGEKNVYGFAHTVQHSLFLPVHEIENKKLVVCSLASVSTSCSTLYSYQFLK